jgi:hypothetical protein
MGIYAHIIRNIRKEKNPNADNKKTTNMFLPVGFKIVLYKKQIIMMRLSTLCFVLLLALNSCNNSSPNTADKNTDKDAVANNPIVASVNILGSYVGSFGDNKITLLITKATADSVSGRSIVGGNDRPFAGILKFTDGIYNISAKEPGDDKYDGAFDFTIDSKQPNTVAGSWKPNTPTTTLKEKTYTLQRKEFRYLQDVGQFPQASKRLLKTEDVENLMLTDLGSMRNEIFARHGYCFQKKELRQQFENLDWYVPNTVDVKKDLTDIEKKNIVLIKKYEKYAQDYGDDYGR